MNMLTARKVSKSYGHLYNLKEVIHQLNLAIDKGEFLGIMGPSGSGKTTLLQLLAGIDRPSEGIINVKGQPLHELSSKQLANFRRHEMAFIFQNYNLLNDLTVKENIMLPFALTKNRHQHLERAHQLAEELGILPLFNKYPHQISGGEQQRVAIARALNTNPSLLFADEPTGALDSKSASKLLETLLGLNKAHCQTILMVTHDAISASYCSRILFLKDGSLYTELYRGERTQQVFYQDIVATQAILGADS